MRVQAQEELFHGMKFFDYISYGIPVVANNIGGWTDVIQHENIGILADSTADSLADGILQLLQNPDMRYDLSKKCLHLAKTKFNTDACAGAEDGSLAALAKEIGFLDPYVLVAIRLKESAGDPTAFRFEVPALELHNH